MKDGDMYYMVVAEWSYPTGGGSILKNPTCGSLDDALKMCDKICDDEIETFSGFTDPLWPARMLNSEHKECGTCITAKNGLDEWWFAAKVIEVRFGMDNNERS